ncbi:MAG: phytase [Hormoscilla sp. GUM202]|nr:phytase [Hormoscilla sp. GUM202]
MHPPAIANPPIPQQAIGPTLPDGRQTLIVISDNNFNDSQITQFLAFALRHDSIPAVAPTLETPAQTRIVDRGNPDLDDPAIYLHPSDPSASLVITALKDAGLAVYDLQGRELQTILPAKPTDWMRSTYP